MRKTQLATFATSWALMNWPALAQTSAPTSSPASSTGGGFGWLWLIVLLAVIGAAVWYFGFARNRTKTTNLGVDRDRVAGSAEQGKGSVKEATGKVLGDAKLQAEGRADQVEGKAQNTVGGIKDTLRGHASVPVWRCNDNAPGQCKPAGQAISLGRAEASRSRKRRSASFRRRSCLTPTPSDLAFMTATSAAAAA